MDIYLFTVMPEGYKGLTLPEGHSLSDNNCLTWGGVSKISGWNRPELVWLDDEFSSAHDKDADFIGFHGAVVISDKARAALVPVLENKVEFLPVLVDGCERYIMNVINVIDVLDKERSIYKVYSDGKQGLCEHAYINESASNQIIFKIHGLVTLTFVNRDFLRLIDAHDLTGALIREYHNPRIQPGSEPI